MLCVRPSICDICQFFTESKLSALPQPSFSSLSAVWKLVLSHLSLALPLALPLALFLALLLSFLPSFLLSLSCSLSLALPLLLSLSIALSLSCSLGLSLSVKFHTPFPPQKRRKINAKRNISNINQRVDATVNAQHILSGQVPHY